MFIVVSMLDNILTILAYTTIRKEASQWVQQRASMC